MNSCAAAGGLEHLIDRPGPAASGHRPSIQPRRRHSRHVGAHQERRTFEQGTPDALTLAGLLPLPQGGLAATTPKTAPRMSITDAPARSVVRPGRS